MVSIDNGKRYKPIEEERSKKLRVNSQVDIPLMISLNSSLRTESLSKLRVLFPLKPIEELMKILDQSNDSFEYAMHLIQKQEQEKYLKACISKTAQDMVIALGSAKNAGEAFEMLKEFLEKNYKKPEEKNLENEISVLNNHVKTLSKENKLLKRAVAKLYENSVGANDKDKIIERLSKELESERIKSYNLSLRLNQAVSIHKFDSNRELF